MRRIVFALMLACAYLNSFASSELCEADRVEKLIISLMSNEAKTGTLDSINISREIKNDYGAYSLAVLNYLKNPETPFVRELKRLGVYEKFVKALEDDFEAQKQATAMRASGIEEGNISYNRVSTEHDTLLYLMEEAEKLARNSDPREITVNHLLIAFAEIDPPFRDIIEESGTPYNEFRAKVLSDSEGSSIEKSKFGVDLVQEARNEKIGERVGRDEEVERVLEELVGVRKTTPLIIGEPGVGKSAILEKIALLIASGDVPIQYRNAKIIEIDLAEMVAGTKYRGDFEARLKKLIKEAMDAEARGEFVILAIDEYHTLMGAGDAEGAAMSAANIIKPALARGKMRHVGLTTINEYRKHIEGKDGALDRRVEVIKVEEPAKDEAIPIMEANAREFERNFESRWGVRVRYTDEAIEDAYNYADRYITKGFMPDKAVDVLESAGKSKVILAGRHLTKIENQKARVADLQREYDNDIPAGEKDTFKDATLDPAKKQLEDLEADYKALFDPTRIAEEEVILIESVDIAKKIEQKTDTPVARITGETRAELLTMEDDLNARIFDQPELVHKTARVIRRRRQKLNDPKRPMGRFVVCGGRGRGKTYFAHTLNDVTFANKPDELVVVDGSNFSRPEDVWGLIGVKAGFKQAEEAAGKGVLTEPVRQKGYRVIMVDEFHQMSDEALNLFYQINENGRIKDGQGNWVYFNNTIILFNTNLSESQVIARYGGLEGSWIDRFDDIITVKDLSEDAIVKIMQREMDSALGYMNAEYGIQGIKLSKGAKNFLLKHGYDPKGGARPMRRAVEGYIVDEIGDLLLHSADGAGDGKIARLVIDNSGGPGNQKLKASFVDP